MNDLYIKISLFGWAKKCKGSLIKFKAKFKQFIY